ncbi:evolutionarily conserved signaling intermediate in Toll pathway, mitochondrial [Alligator mississippiensis]|uniref:evolutionarily conserved signaling intermediate in Toll pathway, mitochondrial n=1 Tax=Alligator mississippiensis TaxID=8496 RepID=UPI0028772A3D|nr:evolutionarily conserved signaling intermediate in Toll pathway, mitochondrial [Alligator mississippiensis]
MNSMWLLAAARGTLWRAALGRDYTWLQSPGCVQAFWTGPLRGCSSGSKLTLRPGDDGDGEQIPRELVPFENMFRQAAQQGRSKATWCQVVEAFQNRDVRRREHVEFIYTALRHMVIFGVERDLDAYNCLLDVFPQGVFVPQNYIQRMFHHYPRQQLCGIQVLEQMETYGIMPDQKTRFLLLKIFGEQSHPAYKYQRIMYWFPKFKHINPYPLPDPLPRDPVDLARHSLTRIAADASARVTIYQMPLPEQEDPGIDHAQPYIVGIQSPDQQELLARHNPAQPVLVEGPFRLWLKTTCVYYYILHAELLPKEQQEEVIDLEQSFYYPLQLDLDLDRGIWDKETFDVEKVEEGPLFAMCMVGAGDQATLAKWIVGLQETNPILSQTSVIFHLRPGPQELQLAPSAAKSREEEEEEEAQARWGTREA